MQYNRLKDFPSNRLLCSRNIYFHTKDQGHFAEVTIHTNSILPLSSFFLIKKRDHINQRSDQLKRNCFLFSMRAILLNGDRALIGL